MLDPFVYSTRGPCWTLSFLKHLLLVIFLVIHALHCYFDNCTRSPCWTLSLLFISGGLLIYYLMAISYYFARAVLVRPFQNYNGIFLCHVHKQSRSYIKYNITLMTLWNTFNILFILISYSRIHRVKNCTLLHKIMVFSPKEGFYL